MSLKRVNIHLWQ